MKKLISLKNGKNVLETWVSSQLAEFEKQGAKLAGLTQVTSRFYACGTNNYELINAVKIEI